LLYLRERFAGRMKKLLLWWLESTSDYGREWREICVGVWLIRLYVVSGMRVESTVRHMKRR